MATEGGVESRARPGRPLIGYGPALPRPTSTRFARPSSSHFDSLSSRRFPSSSLARACEERVSFLRLKPSRSRRIDAVFARSFSFSIHLSIRRQSIRPARPPLFHPFSVSLFLLIRELREQVLGSSPYRASFFVFSFSFSLVHLFPCPAIRLVMSSLVDRALRIFQPADYITAFYQIDCDHATYESSSPPLSACRATLSSGRGYIRF